MEMSEAQLERLCLDWLNKQDEVFAFKVPDQRKCINGVYRADPYIPKGQPDITVWSKGRVSYIEFKTSKGKASKYQQAFIEKALKMEIKCEICRTLSDVKEFYKSLVN